MNHPEPRYRPVMTAEQIETILSICKTTSPLTAQVISVISTLAPFQAKIVNAGITPAYIVKPVESIEEKLGFPPSKKLLDNLGMSPEERRLAAYTKWKDNPVSCSLDEIDLANTYRYENGLMGAEEITAFESSFLNQ